ncbi:MFS transporter [Betaproteobacteria bacterium]|nr:MFS transporter [Betaproteobacteria bacterium]GHU01127.1 MFS transporter [Betaproteobacteria bacterium]GHU17954.1 MFS transporter [Betaproteobacteria bacterium]
MSSTTNFRPLALLIGSAYFMEQLDSTIIAPAIPLIATELGIEPLSLNLTMTIYLLCSVALIPLSGYLAGRLGTRTTFKAALALFVLSSVLCGLADSLGGLIAARALQGTSAALMVPVGRTAIVHATKRSELVLALAWMITPAMLGPVLGPPLGGLIATLGSWRWIFFINLPVGLMGYFAATRLVPQVRDEVVAPFDLRQWLLLAAMLVGLATVLELVRHPGMPAAAYALSLAVALSAGWAYRRHRRQHSGRAALLDFSLLDVATFNTSFWAGALARVGYGALPFLLPLSLQIGLGFSALDSGLVLLANGAVAFLIKTRTAAILARYGFRRVLVWNGLMCALGLAICAFFSAGWGLALIALLASFGGLVRAIQFNAVGAIAYADLPPARIAAATTLNTVFQQLAIMFGISFSVVLVDLSARFAQRAQPATLDFSLAFLVLALVVAAAVPFCWKLDAGAGQELSGHGPVQAEPGRESA